MNHAHGRTGLDAPLPGADPLVFFDTGIIVAAYDPDDAARREQALDLLHKAMRVRRFVVSTQVLQEFYSIVVKYHYLEPTDALAVVRQLAGYRVVATNADLVLSGLALQQRRRLSMWDALIVQAALDARCTVLCSEELPQGLRFEGLVAVGDALTVVNPFATPKGAKGDKARAATKSRARKS